MIETSQETQSIVEHAIDTYLGVQLQKNVDNIAMVIECYVREILEEKAKACEGQVLPIVARAHGQFFQSEVIEAIRRTVK